MKQSMYTCLAFLAISLTIHSTALAENRIVHDIFVDGKLAPGVKLTGGKVKGKEIHTVAIGQKAWADPMFQLRGLNIDISKVDLAQIHVRIVTTGGLVNKPSYADVQVYMRKGPAVHVKQFPFRSWQKNKPDYMMKSLEHIGRQYARTPKGKTFGAITGLGIKASGGFAMRLSKIQILIDKSLDDKYPDDPKADANWKGGKITSVFAIGGSERLLQNQKDSPLKAGNSVWKNGEIHLAGARNETVAFQVIMQAAPGENGINGVNVKFTGVRKGPDRIDNAKVKNPNDPYDYVGRHIQLYRTRYVLYSKPRRGKASGTTDKYIPEIQIPFEAKWGGAPFPIFPGKTQAVWVDIYIPKNAVAGLYTGQVDVQVAGRSIKRLPVKLTVQDFSLPNKPTVVSAMLGYPSSKHGAKTPEEKWELEKTYRQFFRRNHTELFRGFRPGTNEKVLQDPKSWLLRSGDIYMARYGYEGPGEGVATTFIFICMYGGGLKPFGGPGISGTEEDWHRGLLKYFTAARKYAPGATLVYYVWDEPSHDFKGGIPAFTKWFNRYPGPFVDSFNKKYKADIKLYSSVNATVERQVPLMDIYTAKSRKAALEIAKRGDICAKWNGPQSIGHPASALRVVGWQAYYYKSSFWWMWHAVAYGYPFDVYRNVNNFRNQYGENLPGFGMFVYPGTDTFLPKRSPGLKGPVPGTRFFNWRQGFIDAEYLSLAARKNPEAVLNLVKDMVSGTSINSGLPGEKTSSGYPTTEARYVAARARLVKIILGQ